MLTTANILLGISIIYVIAVVVHVFAFIQYANKYYSRMTAPQAVLIFVAALFWWVVWIWYGIERLRGRVA